jgi:hypothetical protein
LPLNLPHPDPETLPEREYEGRFFRSCLKKQVLSKNTGANTTDVYESGQRSASGLILKDAVTLNHIDCGLVHEPGNGSLPVFRSSFGDCASHLSVSMTLMMKFWLESGTSGLNRPPIQSCVHELSIRYEGLGNIREHA